MKLSSMVAIYALFWSLSFFLVLPFRLRSSPEPDARVPGQAESAPPRFSFARTAKWTTLVAAILFCLYYLNYVNQWLPVQQLDLVPEGVLTQQHRDCGDMPPALGRDVRHATAHQEGKSRCVLR